MNSEEQKMFAYGDMLLDRCTNQRKNKRWLNSEFNHDTTLFCVIKDGKSLFPDENIGEEPLTPLYLQKASLPTITIANCIYLGKGSEHSAEFEHISIFAVDYDKLRFSTQESLSEIGQWQPLKSVTPHLSAIDASILSLAKALAHWHSSHQFCGHCGESNLAVEAGHARRCTNCRNVTFPRTDPAVIMLVEKMFADGVPRCLLGRQPSWADGMYSTMAGFVDPGETLEQAVIREVLEETTIIAVNPQYVASQPWPFPGSIMLAFTVEAVSEEIEVSQDSLEDAQWFSREQLDLFGTAAMDINEKHDDNNSPQYKMSSKNSISSYLISAWKNKEIGIY